MNNSACNSEKYLNIMFQIWCKQNLRSFDYYESQPHENVIIPKMLKHNIIT